MSETATLFQGEKGKKKKDRKLCDKILQYAKEENFYLEIFLHSNDRLVARLIDFDDDLLILSINQKELYCFKNKIAYFCLDNQKKCKSFQTACQEECKEYAFSAA